MAMFKRARTELGFEYPASQARPSIFSY